MFPKITDFHFLFGNFKFNELEEVMKKKLKKQGIQIENKTE